MNKLLFLSLMLLCVSESLVLASPGQRFKRVIQIVFENTNYEKAAAQKDFAAFASQGALLTNLLAEGHPSQGNYIAMISGSNYGVKSDAPVNLNQKHLGDLLEAANLKWRVYAENYPGSCYLGSVSGSYARKHVPFLSFVSVSKNPTRCSNVVEAANFDRDFASNSLPEFSFFVPNLEDDGHNTGVDYAGKWFSQKFGSVLANQDFMKDTLFVITFDENDGKGPNRVFTVLLGGAIRAGSQSSNAYTHASLLRLVEDEFNLGTLGQLDQSSDPIDGIWN
jgi:hypothetical protein